MCAGAAEAPLFPSWPKCPSPNTFSGAISIVFINVGRLLKQRHHNEREKWRVIERESKLERGEGGRES